jgi:hypothetical protein
MIQTPGDLIDIRFDRSQFCGLERSRGLFTPVDHIFDVICDTHVQDSGVMELIIMTNIILPSGIMM